MTFLSLPVFTILFLAQLGFLGTIVLILHRLSPRFGLAPLFIFLGTCTAVLEYRALGTLDLQFAGLDLTLSQGSFILLPILLLGLLVIYIVNGTQQARLAMLGVIFVTLIFAFIHWLPDFRIEAGDGQILATTPPAQPPSGMVASALAIGGDLVIMIVVYQAVSNLRNRHPSRTAALLALMAAVWSDAFLYPLLSSSGFPQFSSMLAFHLGGKSLAVLVLWPLLSSYISYVTPLLPESAATTPRPTLDIFTTALQLEARARRHYSLLRTVSQINQLIVRTNDRQILLSQACQLLVDQRDYPLVWIGQIQSPEGKNSGSGEPAAWSGRSRAVIEELRSLGDSAPFANQPGTGSNESGQVVLKQDFNRDAQHNLYQRAALKYGLRSSALLPMRYAGSALGTLHVFAAYPNAFDPEEVEILQEMADDLAYALISLEARQQQAILNTATETMQDGLFITDLNGCILYANPAISSLLEIEPEKLTGQDLRQILPSSLDYPTFDMIRETLEKKQKFDFDLEMTLPNRRVAYFSIRSSLAKDARNFPAYIIINARDTTSQHQYEHRLITLIRFTTELVQTRDVHKLVERLFTTSEALLNADASGFYPLGLSLIAGPQAFIHNIPENPATQPGQLLDLLTGTRSYLPRRAVVVADTLNDPGYATRLEALANEGVRALLLLPVVLQEQPVGALVLYYREPRTFSEEEIRLGLTLGHTLAISLENAHLYQAEKSQREFAEALAHGAAALSSSLDFDRVLDQILDQAIRVIGCRSVNIMLIEGDVVRVVRHVDRTDPEELKRPVTGKQLPLTLPTLQIMLEEGKPLVISNTFQDAIWRQLEQTTWISSYAAAPLQVEGQIIGFLNMNSDQVDFFDSAIIPRLQAFADTAAAAIRNAHLYKESQQRGEELSTLVDAAAVFSTSLDLNQVLHQVAEQMVRMLNIRGCAISDYYPETNTVQLISEYGPKQWDQEGHNVQPFLLDQYPQTKGVIETGKPALLHTNDLGLDSMEREYMEENHIKTLLMLPLRAQDRTIGLVELIDDQTVRFFTQREIELVQTLASHAATAIENARLYQRTQQYTSELEDRVMDRTLELSTAKESIEYILRSVPDSIFVLDENNRVIQANPAGDALIRQAEEEGIDIFAPEFASGLTHLTTSAEKAVLTIRDRSYQALASSLDIEGRSSGTVVIFRDVTRFHELDEMKNQFVSDVSHELRTPLTNLNLYLDLLHKVTDPEKSKRYLATLRRETQRLTELIEDLLTISRLEAGRMEFDIEPVDVNRIVAELAVDRMQMAAQQELTLTYSIQPELPLARADFRLITQVLSNLLTNALNYTPPKESIHVETSLQEWEGESWITICVKDTGLGIAPDEMEYLFTRFFRGSASQATNAPGTGLGLAISQEIIDRLDGRITVESQLHQGSTFTVWLKTGL